MNALLIASFACLMAYASASIYGIHAGYGAHVVPAGPTTLVGASGVVGPHGAVGPAGAVNGHGAVGPNGIPNALHHGAVLAAPAIVGGVGIAHAGIGAIAYGHDDGQWHGEGLWESQDHAGRAAAILGGHGLGYALGHGLW